MQSRVSEIDDMIEHEKLLTAMEHQDDAWADGLADGIEPEIILNAAISHAMRETIRLYGESGAEAVLDELRARMLAGEFSPDRKVQ